MAAPLSPDQALLRASGNTGNHLPSKDFSSPTLVYTTMSETLQPTSYIFNGEGSYMIVSADDSAIPLLGYGTGNINPSSMPENMLWWLGEYGRQIEYMRSKGMNFSSDRLNALEDLDPIEPMLKTMWNQDAPYNDQCPQIDGVNTYTGCVATAMAQVMNYFQYPDVGEGSIQYTPPAVGRRLSLDFSRTPFDWDNMLNAYGRGTYTDAQKNAVAYLMKACGYSIKMGYNVTQSGTQSALVAYAARTYFKYDQNTFCYFRDIYPTNEWTQMMYDNLANVGPVLMGGQAVEGGHSFVCDGYDGNGYFHFNWGWGGSSDGYYALDVLSPEVLGIGGYEGGFNYHQDAIFGMQPPTGEPVKERVLNLYQYGYTSGSLSGKTLTYNVEGDGLFDYKGWGNVFDETISVEVGSIITPIDGNEEIIVPGKRGNYSKVTLETGTLVLTNSGLITVELPDLADGVYKAYVAGRDTYNGEGEWTPLFVKWSFPNYVLLTVSNGAYSIENVLPAKIKLDEANFTSPLYFNRYVFISATVTNDNDIELTRTITPVLFKGDSPELTGETAIVTLEPYETATKEWLTKFNYKSGTPVTEETEFTLKFLDLDSGEYYGSYGTVVMKPEPVSGNPTLMGFNILGAERGPYENGDISYPNVYYVPDYDFTAQAQIRVQRGFYDGVITAGIYEDDGNSNYLVPVLPNIYEIRPLLEGDTTITLDIPVDFKTATPGKIYYFVTRYSSGRSNYNLSQSRFLIGESGIETIGTEENEKVEYFNLQGLRIENPQPGQIVVEKSGTNTRKIIFK